MLRLVLLLPLLLPGCNLVLPLGPGPDGRDGRPVLDGLIRPDRRPADAAADEQPSDAEPQPVMVLTLAGTGVLGFQNGPVNIARFNHPHDVAVAPDGRVYVADWGNHCIRTIDNGQVSTLAGRCQHPGFKDGAAADAQFHNPASVTLDGEGNLYVADFGNQRVRRIAIGTGNVTTVAGTGESGTDDGLVTAATFDGPDDVAVDISGSTPVLYVPEYNNNRIRAIQNGKVSTLTGQSYGEKDGTLGEALFARPHMLILSGQLLYLADFDGSVRLIDLTASKVSTLIKKNPGSMSGTAGLALNPGGTRLYLSVQQSHQIEVLDLTAQPPALSVVAGDGSDDFLDGPAAKARFKGPEGLFYHQGVLYVADYDNHRIRMVTGL